MNYTELTQAIQDYCENDEATFVANIPNFVRQAEELIHRTAMIPELRKNVTGTITSGNRYLARPADFLSPFSIAIVDAAGDYQYLLDKDVNFIREAYPSTATTGQPKYYAQFSGDNPTAGTEGFFIVGPTPDQDYTVELYYYYDPASIVDSTTSWLGNHAKTALLYGSLIEAYIFMKGDPDLMAEYQSRYTRAMAGLGVIEVRSNRDDYRDGRLQARGR
jgi:hypothetical protein